MTIHQLLSFYSGLVKSVGVDQAKKRIYDLGYNKTLSTMIPMLFDDKGNPIKLKADH